MSILQISRVQVRRGLQENLPPQLASGELGWSIDERRLFIGNGTYEEHAPELGNTEILTQHWADSGGVLNLTGGYIFKGSQDGLLSEVQTGLTSGYPIARSMQAKFDDIANSRDFGSNGDSSQTDVAHEINHAITQLYKDTLLQTEPLVRRTLHLPAGTYNLTSDFIRMIPYVKLKGDGKNSTFIVQNSSTPKPVVQAMDLEVTAGVPLMPPGYCEIEGITLINNSGSDVVYLDSATDMYFNRVAFSGPTPFTPNGLNHTACVKVGTEADTPPRPLTSKLAFNDCDFINYNYALYCDNSLNDVQVIGGNFNNLWRGVNLGELYTGTANISSIRITNSVFDNVVNTAIFAATSASVSHVVSAFNTFKNCSNGLPIISFGGDNCYSIGDVFDRAFDAAVPAIDLKGKSSFATLSNGRFMLGKQLTVGGKGTTLVAASTNALAGIIGYGLQPTTVEYSITRDANQRTGVLKITSAGATIVYDDEYVETNDLDITLIPTLNLLTNVIELHYTVGTGTNATLTTSSRTLL